MKKRFLVIICLISYSLFGSTQEKLVLTSASFHELTSARTLEFLNYPDIRNDFLKNLDTVVQTYLGRQLNYPNNFIFKSYKPEITDYTNVQFNLRKKDMAMYDKSTNFLAFDISERPLNIDMDIKDLDTTYINELLKKRNICIYQLNAKMIRSDESVVMDKQLFILLARQDNSSFIGVEHPLYNLAPSGFTKVLKTCLPILLDSSNESELIQVIALPAYVNENFIQSEIGNNIKTSTRINKNIVQFQSKNGLQSLRFQEPGFEPIVLKGKKVTPISGELQSAIRSENGKNFIFLWEEGRDVYANKNFKLVTVATAAEDPIYEGKSIWVNRKTGIPLDFLKGNFHCLLENNDTIAHFSIQSQVIDSSKKVYFNQLLNIKDNAIFNISKNNQAASHIYHYVLNGVLRNKTFKILISGISGSSSIKEIFYDNQLVCVAQGVLFPEILSIIEPALSPENLNTLLWFSFSSLF
jgi:hypothetical protein